MRELAWKMSLNPNTIRQQILVGSWKDMPCDRRGTRKDRYFDFDEVVQYLLKKFN